MTHPFDGLASDGGQEETLLGQLADGQVMIPKEAYFLESVLDLEMQRIFSSCWQFAAMLGELQEHQSFVTLDLPRVAIVIQNFRGTIKAFQNICTHRFNRLQLEERGKRPLLCGYHGWNFNAEGFPAGRAKKEQFPMISAEDRERLCLPEYRLETCGKFVFVNIDGRAPPLREYLGSKAQILEEISESFGSEVQFRQVPHAANWKLLVENVLECYHCAAVHSETFISGLGIGRLPIEKMAYEGPHSSCHFPRSEVKREHLRRRILSHLDKRSYAHNSFFHLFVFPNLFVSSQEGLTFYVGQALPRTSRSTMLSTRVFEPKVDLTENQRARQDLLNQQSLEIAAKVIEEDREILENVQRGIELSSNPGVLGTEEERIKTFLEHYRSALTPSA